MRKPVLNIAIGAARKAGSVILRHLGRVEAIPVTDKGRFDFVSEVDRQAEAEIVRELKRTYPEHAILAEESGASGRSRYTWIIDPLDGTSNFLHGFPHFAVSIALAEAGTVQVGVVYDPLRDELYTALRGGGAFLNERRLRVNQKPTLVGALLATGFPARQRSHLPRQLRMVRALLAEAEDLRRTGSAALDLCYVAAGRLDGFFEAGLKPWDLAAGALIVREAGGLCCDFEGGELDLDRGTIVAANIKLAAAMVARIKPTLAKAASATES